MTVAPESVCAVCPVEHIKFNHCSGPLGCHYSWTGTAECHCTVCHLQFSSDTAFDLHLTSDRCKDPSPMRRKNGLAIYRVIHRTDPVTHEPRPVWALAHPSQNPFASSAVRVELEGTDNGSVVSVSIEGPDDAMAQDVTAEVGGLHD